MVNQKPRIVLRNLRIVGVVEGISFLVLLFIAMPLKYLAGMPTMVKYVGWAHGVLFVGFVLLLAIAQYTFRWSFIRLVLSFISSLIPFGTFILDRKLRVEEKAIQY